ncbi:MAG: stage II sporulation protein P [Lachnospiraceae bacterium]|nr:stage II sporulation protein P [Lachnospiraceae bacterium]
MIHRLRKWFLLILLIITLVLMGKQKNGQENFWKIGRKVALEGVLTRMMYQHSVLWGLVQEMETGFFIKEPKLMVESVWQLPKDTSVISTGEDMLQKVIEENTGQKEVQNQTFYLTEQNAFRPVKEKQVFYDFNQYKSVDELVKQFYTVDSTTAVAEDLFQIEKLKAYDCGVDRKTEGAQILIYHTHSQEAFMDSRAGVEEDTIVGAGELLTSYLEEYGFKVYHHKGKYDIEKRDYAYSESLPEITKILKENPDIQVVIDLHRDAVAEDTRLVTTLQGKQVAKVMFFNGLSRTSSQGKISYLENPYLQENLAFSFQMKVACDEYYPGFARSIYLRAYRYNMHLCPKTLLVELGAQTNTVEEIQGALAPLAHVLSMVLE